MVHCRGVILRRASKHRSQRPRWPCCVFPTSRYGSNTNKDRGSPQHLETAEHNLLKHRVSTQSGRRPGHDIRIMDRAPSARARSAQQAHRWLGAAGQSPSMAEEQRQRAGSASHTDGILPSRSSASAPDLPQSSRGGPATSAPCPTCVASSRLADALVCSPHPVHPVRCACEPAKSTARACNPTRCLMCDCKLAEERFGFSDLNIHRDQQFAYQPDLPESKEALQCRESLDPSYVTGAFFAINLKVIDCVRAQIGSSIGC